MFILFIYHWNQDANKDFLILCSLSILTYPTDCIFTVIAFCMCGEDVNGV